MVIKLPNKKNAVDNLEKFYSSKEEDINFLQIMLKRWLMLPTEEDGMEQNKKKKREQRAAGLKILTPKKMF